MVHDGHDCILVPPLWVLDTLHLAAHDYDLTGGDQLSATVCRSQMLWDTSRRHFAVEGLCETLNHFCPLPSREGGWWARSQYEVSVQVYNKGVGGSGEQRSAFRRYTKDVGAWLLYEVLDVTCMHDRYVQAAPLIHPNAISHRFSCDSKDCGVMASKDDPSCWRYCCLDYANNVGNGKTGE